MSRHSMVHSLGVLVGLAFTVCCSPTTPSDPLPVTRVLQGAFSSAETPQRLVVRSEAELAAAWTTMFRTFPDAPPLPSVDFSRDMVIVALAGSKPSSGYCVLVQSAAGTSKWAEIMVRSVGPSPGTVLLPVVTNPYDVVRVPRRDLVTFTEFSEVGNCGPLT